MSDLIMVPIPEETLTVEIDAKNRAEDIRNQLVALIRQEDRTFLKIGAYMLEIQRSKLYKDLRYSSLEEFCFQELNRTSRQVRNYVTVHEKFIQELNVSEDVLLEIGSTKLKELAQVATSENVQELLSFAKDNNVFNVSNRVNAMQTDDEITNRKENNGEKEVWQVVLTPRTKELMNEAVETAKLLIGLEAAGAACEMIAAEFLATHGDEEQKNSLISIQFTREEKNILSIALARAAKDSYASSLGSFIADAVRLWIDTHDK